MTATDPGTLPPRAGVQPPAPDSVSWRVHADPMMWVAGLRALYLQALHPRVIRGFLQNSDYEHGSWQRLARTADYVGTTTYGTVEEAHRAAARVRRIHDRLSAVDPDTGERYGIGDPDLLLWVHCCEIDSYLDTVRRSGMRLTAADADRYVREQRWRAWMVGIDPLRAPVDRASLAACLAGYRPVLAATAEARAAARFVLLPPMRRSLELSPARPGWAGIAAVAFGLLPRWARRMYGLPEPVPVAGPAAAVAARALRTGLLAVPRQLREGPHVRNARRRLATAAGRPA